MSDSSSSELRILPKTRLEFSKDQSVLIKLWGEPYEKFFMDALISFVDEVKRKFNGNFMPKGGRTWSTKTKKLPIGSSGLLLNMRASVCTSYASDSKIRDKNLVGIYVSITGTNYKSRSFYLNNVIDTYTSSVIERAFLK